MGVNAVKSHPISSSNSRRRRFHFPEGSSVEVRTDEKGLKAVYFTATVVPPPPPSSALASSRKKSRKLIYVEFHNLVTEENGTEKLREYIDVSFVRPTPPALQEDDEAARAFQPDDVVDAFWNDGWWMGEVSRVVEGGKRVVVTFQNPPDVREFRVSDVRAHWDWVDGIWVKKQSIGFRKSMFGGEKAVEISLDERSNGDAWIPAIVHRNLGNGNLLVEYDLGEDVIAEIDIQNARPCPLVPIKDEKKFSLFEEVDAYLDHVWRSGVIREELENGRYVVFLKKTKQDKDFSRWDLRSHMEWKDGKWLLSSISDVGVLDVKLSLGKRRKHPPVSETVVENEAGDGVQDRHDNGSVIDMETAQSTVGKKPRSVLGKKINRTPAWPRINKESSLQDSVCLAENWSLDERGSINSVVQIEDSLGGKMVLVNDLEEMQHSSSETSVKQQKGSEAQAASSLVDKDSMLTNELQSLPFVKDRKTSSVWETIESLPVFQRFPQKPHFKPLEQIEESLREGKAISYMISFSGLVERACTLRLNDPKGIIDEIMEELVKMGQYGFDVGLVQDKLTNLLDLKIKLEKLVDEAKEFHSHVSEHSLKRGRIEEERRELLEKLSCVESAIEKEDSEISSLQGCLEVIEESIKIVGSDFEGIVSSIL
ncbi:hypothetical protein ACS0TY_025760 [Phlomoides rotata]